jgi:hypothetical protein
VTTLRERIAEHSARYWREYPGSARFWDDLRADLEGHPEEPGGLARRKCRHPTTTALRKALKSGRPVPEWAADYICGRLDGTVKLPRGAPEWSAVGLDLGERSALCPGWARTLFRHLQQDVIRRAVKRWMRILRHPRYAREYKRKYGLRPPKRDVYQQAKQRVAAKYGMTVDTVDSYVYPRKKRGRPPCGEASPNTHVSEIAISSTMIGPPGATNLMARYATYPGSAPWTNRPPSPPAFS